MKKVLITGTNSFIGNSFEDYVARFCPEVIQIDTLNVRGDDWKSYHFAHYDTIFHVAGIAHFSKDESQKSLYYQVNRDLTKLIAQKAKNEGVKHFIFMSSIIIYGDSTNKERIITRKTVPSPSDFYGDSKWQAEKCLQQIASPEFNVAIVRPPMIYGRHSKGNYPKLAKLAKITPLFPKINNQRSMLHIDNLCEFLKQIIVLERSGIFFPQNRDYVCTSELVVTIAKRYGKKVNLTSLFNPLIRLFFFNDTIKKLFGNLVYDHSLSQYDFNYQIREFEESITLTETDGK